MSARWKRLDYERTSGEFKAAALAFIGPDLQAKNVLEIGCGPGRFTVDYVAVAKSVTAVEISPAMIKLCKAELGSRASDVRFVQKLACEYWPDRRFDAAVSCQVLAHIVDNAEFVATASMLDRWAAEIFLFEHTGGWVRTSKHTHVRPERELLSAFPGHTVVRSQTVWLFDDKLSFFKLGRRTGSQVGKMEN